MADEVANLKNLWRQGMLTASEFAKMAAQASAEASQAAEEEEAEEEEAGEEELGIHNRTTTKTEEEKAAKER